MGKILVWDWPVRIGHWLMVAGFATAWLTAGSEDWRGLHLIAGATVAAVAIFRLLWGFVGSRYARFADFVSAPAAVGAYLASLVRLRPQAHVGHNPAGGWAIVALLSLALAAGGSGWLLHEEFAGHWLEELHESLAGLMLAVVATHVAGVFLGSVLHRENLVRAMLTGRKEGAAGEGIASSRPLAAVLLLAWVGIAGWLIAA